MAKSHFGQRQRQDLNRSKVWDALASDREPFCSYLLLKFPPKQEFIFIFLTCALVEAMNLQVTSLLSIFF